MKIAAFTFVQDDDPFIPVWERYYTPQFDTVDRVKYNHAGKFDPGTALSQVITMFTKLLDGHDVVLFSDLDEMIVPNPNKYSGLRDYIEQRSPFDYIQTFGFDVIHAPGEDALDFSAPILPQRTKMIQNGLYSKPLITTRVLSWSWGLHYVKPSPSDGADRDLVLFHLLLADHDTALMRLRKRRRITEDELYLKINGNTQLIPDHYKIA